MALAYAWRAAAPTAIVLLTASAIAQQPQALAPEHVSGAFRTSQAFTFLFLAMGPIPLIPAFAAMTEGRDRSFKRALALYGAAIAAVAVVIAATSGVGALQGWGVSRPALVLAIGLLLLLIALRTVLDVYTPARARPAASASADTPPTLTQLAFSPLAFPTIIPPFGIGIVVLLLALAQERGAMATLAGMFATVLILDLLAMLFADWIMRAPFIKYALYTLGAVMSVLQVSLAVQAIADSIRELNIL